VKEPKQFNDFLKHICKFCRENRLHSFCQYLASKDLTLISKTEAVDRFLYSHHSIHTSVFLFLFSLLDHNLFFGFFNSDVTDEEARCFLVKSEPKVE